MIICSDPYIKIIAGKGKKQTVNARDEYIKKTLSPDFFKFYEVPVTFPGMCSNNCVSIHPFVNYSL
jgi:hypothetical protein